MRTLSLIHNGEQQTIELPANMAYAGLDELAINREGGVITLAPSAAILALPARPAKGG